MMQLPTLFTHPARLGLLAALGSLTVFSCQRQEGVPSPDAYTVTSAQARQVAQNLYASPGMLGQRIFNKRAGGNQLLVEHAQPVASISVVTTANGQPGLYLCSYTGGGYAIIPADRHLPAVLAFSTQGSLPSGSGDAGADPSLSSGLRAWLDKTQAAVAALRENPWEKNVAKGAPATWKMLLDEPLSEAAAEQYVTTQAALQGPVKKPVDVITNRLAPNDPPPSDPPTVQRGPLVQTTWGQFTPYNARCPDSGHNSICPTGCTATAMAQIMRYWQSPANYNWNAMPYQVAPSTGYPELAQLMRDIGDDVAMDYRDGKSSAQPYRMAKAFHDNFGYTSADYHDYPNGSDGTNVDTYYYGNGTSYYGDVMSNLDRGWPVIFGGSTDQNNYGGFKEGAGKSHAWVGDGYIQSYYQGNGYLHFHMNWGEDTNRHDGWYAYNSWAVYNQNGDLVFNYQYCQEVTINIHPY